MIRWDQIKPSAQEKLFIEPLRARVLASVMPRFAEGLAVERAALGNDAGLIGAACFFFGAVPLIYSDTPACGRS